MSKAVYVMNWIIFLLWTVMTPYFVYRGITSSVFYILLAGLGVFVMYGQWQDIKRYRAWKEAGS